MIATTCPSRNSLLAYHTGELPEVAAEGVIAHISSCAACQATLGTFDEADDTFVARLRSPTEVDPYVAEPEFRELLARAERLPEKVVIATGPAPAGASQPPALGQLGEYQLLAKLGEGGMGAVYKARHTRLKRIVALKLLAREPTRDQKAVARFEREMEAVGQVNHPNIVQAHDARESEGTLVLVMECVEGVNLSALVKQHGPLPVADACELIRQAAVALQHVHEHGLVHRDVKPSNLMLTPQGQVKLLDLGLALLRESPAAANDTVRAEADATSEAAVPAVPARAADLTGTQVLGTRDYMAPEQTQNPHAVDIRADVYGLGCTLYKLLTDRAPFEGSEYATSMQKISAHAQVPVPPLGEQRAEVPEELAAIVDRMLAKSPADRFATPAEVAEALKPFAAGSDLGRLLGGVSGEPKAETVAATARAISPPRRRRRLALAAAAGAAAVLLLGMVILLSTAKGTVKIEFTDADAARQCKVLIDGHEIRIENLGEPIRLWPGKHQLRLMHGDLEIETREFTVLRRGQEVLRVSIPVPPKETIFAGGTESKKQAISPRSASARAEDHCRRARDELDKGEFSQAIAAYSEAIRLAPANAGYYDDRGLAHAHLGKFDKAIADFSEAIRLAPALARLYHHRAEVYASKPDYDKAIADFTEAIRLSPTGCWHYHFRGAAYACKGDHDKAIADRSEAIRLDPENAWFYHHRGCSYVAKGEFDKAIADFSDAIRLDPENAWFYHQRGRCYAAKGEFGKTVADLVEEIRLDRKAADSPDRGTVGCLTKAEFDKVLGRLSSLAQLEPKDAEDWHALSLVCLGAGRLDRYRKSCAEVLRRFGQSEKAQEAYWTAWTCALAPDAVADWPKVVALAEKVAQSDPQSPEYATALGAILYCAGSYEPALKRLSEANRVAREPSERSLASPAYTWLFLAMAHHRLGHTAEAKKWLDKATAWTDKALQDHAARTGTHLPWNRRATLKLLRDEAEKVIVQSQGGEQKAERGKGK